MINTVIGKHKILRLIGEGGMASVYEAEHEMLGTKVAIKVLNPILSTNAQIRERFRNEAKLMASLNHPNITRVIDFDEQPQQLSIILEFLEGEDLNDKIKREGALNETQITEIFSQTLLAFQYAHEQGIVHRDIKPSNIFILPNGQVKVLDFGIAKLFGQGNEMTQTGTQMGTPIYMSPEQVKGDKSIDHRSDIYSLGVTMYFAINGKPPYNAETESQFDIFNKIVFEPLSNFFVDSKFNALVLIACQKNREQRFQNCKDWLMKMQKNNEKTAPISSLSAKNSDSSNAKNDSINNSNIKKPKNRNKRKIAIGASIIALFLIAFISFKYYKNTQLEKGISFYNLKEYEKAFKIFNTSMLKGNAETQYYLGKMYYYGQFVEQNKDKAFLLAKESAEQKNPKGLNLLGVCFQSGSGVKEDINKAIECYNKAAYLGYAKGFYNLGNIYHFGAEGINKNNQLAIENYLNCIDLADDQTDKELSGEPENTIGEIYQLGGSGVEIDLIKAKEYYLKAIDKNNAYASAHLGFMYYDGKGIPLDLNKAFRYSTISANLNNALGQHNLGYCYLNGYGCNQDEYKAFELFKKSAEQGNSYGLANLGYMYEANRGGAGYDISKARMYYQKAANLGNEWAKQKLNQLNFQPKNR